MDDVLSAVTDENCRADVSPVGDYPNGEKGNPE
jgi:hypothetical protein